MRRVALSSGRSFWTASLRFKGLNYLEKIFGGTSVLLQPDRKIHVHQSGITARRISMMPFTITGPQSGAFALRGSDFGDGASLRTSV